MFRRRSRVTLALGCLAVALVWGPVACDRSQSAGQRNITKPPNSLPNRQVNTARSIIRPQQRKLVTLGWLMAEDQTTLSAKVPGRLQTLKVDLGSQVRAGETVAQIEPREYQLKVQQAEAALIQARVRLGLPLEGTEDRIEAEQISSVKQASAILDEARSNHERIRKLREEGISSQADLDTAISGFGVALNHYQDALEEARQRQALVVQRRAELEIARQQLADTTVLAPYDGSIQERRGHLGEYLAVGAPILTLVRMDPLRLRFEVSEREASKVRAGQKVRLTVEGDTNIYCGEIKRLSPAFNEQNRMLAAEADVPNRGALHPGSFARAEIVISESAPALCIDARALVTFSGLEKVLTIQDGRTVERRVVTGDRQEGWIEIVSGLQPDEVVVLNPGGLQSGQKVTEAP